MEREEGRFVGVFKENLQPELDKYILRASKRGWYFVVVKTWNTISYDHYRPHHTNRVRLLDCKTGIQRNLFYCGGWSKAGKDLPATDASRMAGLVRRHEGGAEALFPGTLEEEIHKMFPAAN